MERIAILLFAKYPLPGLVKTRMTPPLTSDEACHLHHAGLCVTIEWLRKLDQADRFLVLTPDECLPHGRDGFGDFVTDVWNQGTGDLGQRLIAAMNRAVERDYDAILFLGADSPTLPLALLQRAIQQLARCDVVLGPCDDGGYYLIGVKRSLPALFSSIRWGSSDVLSQTRQRIADAKLSLYELPLWYDLDTFDDLKRASGDLESEESTRTALKKRLGMMIASLLEKYDHG